MATSPGNLARPPGTSRNAYLENLSSEMVLHPSSHADSSFLLTYLPLRAKNPNAHTSISLSTVANVANVFLFRSARARGKDFLEWDADDVVGVVINLIDQVRFCEGFADLRDT